MQNAYYYNPNLQTQHQIQNEERFIGPIIPFIGGALIGYIAGRPQYTSYPSYYPVYYPYYPNYYYYQRPYNYGTNSVNTN